MCLIKKKWIVLSFGITQQIRGKVNLCKVPRYLVKYSRAERAEGANQPAFFFSLFLSLHWEKQSIILLSCRYLCIKQFNCTRDYLNKAPVPELDSIAQRERERERVLLFLFVFFLMIYSGNCEKKKRRSVLLS